MSQNLQSGDLALTLVFDTEIPQGSQVELVERIQKGQLLIGKDRQMKAPTAGWYVTQAGTSAKVAYGDAELMPLRGKGVPTPKLEVEEICYLFKVPA
ncbi:hypothetical protein DFS21_11073 [Pseudomonas sp. 2848]|uniref:hypothetical protein n=1 Tax=Pseudomonas sp. 2848 TaxID=2183926 RepID=UPI000DAED309|nr:hypothetical protein [Pseudomonas sp. 2848]PZW76621.1 hypothetical protein DFS21_11073 [Pseudomonas sp. 2848]